MAKFIATTLLFVLSFTIGVLVMIYGWGLQPVSWWWIVGAGIAGRLLVEVMAILVRKE